MIARDLIAIRDTVVFLGHCHSRVFQLAEASLSKGGEKAIATEWQIVVEEMKKLTPQRQAWLAQIILSALKSPTH